MVCKKEIVMLTENFFVENLQGSHKNTIFLKNVPIKSRFLIVVYTQMRVRQVNYCQFVKKYKYKRFRFDNLLCSHFFLGCSQRKKLDIFKRFKG